MDGDDKKEMSDSEGDQEEAIKRKMRVLMANKGPRCECFVSNARRNAR